MAPSLSAGCVLLAAGLLFLTVGAHAGQEQNAAARRRQKALEELPPPLRPRPAPPMEEINNLGGPLIDMRAGRSSLMQVVYSSPVLRRWIEPCLQERFFQLPAWVRMDQRPAGELLTAVAAAMNSVLRPSYGVVVITDCPGLEKWLPLGLQYHQVDPTTNSVRFVFTSGQLAVIDSGGRVGFAQLRPDQQNIIRSRIWSAYAFSGMVGPDALLLQDVYLELDPEQLEVLGKREIRVMASSRAAGLHYTASSMSRDEARVGPPVRGTYGQPPAELPASLTGVPPPCPRMKQVDLKADENLKGLLPPAPSAPTVGSSLLHLVTHAKINSVSITKAERRSVSLPSGRIPTAQLMELIAAEVGGAWGKLGETYVLLPDPRLELEARMPATLAPFFLEAGLRELLTMVGSRGRTILERTNYLRPRQFNKEQKFALERLVRMAAVAEPLVDLQRALALDEVRLVYIAGEKGEGAAGLELRDRAGQRLLAVQVPLDPAKWDDLPKRLLTKLRGPG